MKQAIRVIFLAILIAGSVSPRQQNSASGKNVSPDFKQVKERLSNPQPETGIKTFVSMSTSLGTPNQSGRIKASRPNYSTAIPLPEYVFKDGAFYMVLPSANVLIPMIGGGASGCFDKDLDRREQTLNGYVKKLPHKF
jgi:hypothetical protein